MFSDSWWQRLCKKTPHRSTRRPKAGASTRRMELEPLENRLVPSTITVHNFNDGAVVLDLTNNNIVAPNLRSAVADAQHRPGNTQILLDTGTYQLNNAYGGELQIAFLNNAASLTIKNNAGGVSTINANNQNPNASQFRIFEVLGNGQAAATLDHLKLTGGSINAPFGSEGGAILNHGVLHLTNDQITNNHVNAGYGGDAEGGGIYNDPGTSLTILNSEIDHNTATGYGGTGGLGFTIPATNAAGGGLYIEGATGNSNVLITGSTFDNNTATGGSFTGSEGSAGSAGNAFGGSIAIGTPTGPIKLNISNSTFNNNLAYGGQATKNVNSFGYGGFLNVNGGSAFGGAIHIDPLNTGSVVNIVNSTLANNFAYGGGAVNTGSAYGGTFFNGGSAFGGALHVDSANTKPVNLVNDTIAFNEISAGSASDPHNNTLPGAAAGGGVDTSTSTVPVVGFRKTQTAGEVNVLNTIIARNFNDSNSMYRDISGNFNSLGHNLLGTSYGGSGGVNGFSAAKHDLLNVDPEFDPAGLKNNGGPTQTIALDAISPAINAADNSVVQGGAPFTALGIPKLTTDQRGPGFSRIVGRNSQGVPTVDIGAYELQLNLDKFYTVHSSSKGPVTLTIPAPGLLAGNNGLGLLFEIQTAYEVIPIVNGHPAPATTLNVNSDGSFTFTVPANSKGVVTFLFHLRVRLDEEGTEATNLFFQATITVLPPTGGGRDSFYIHF